MVLCSLPRASTWRQVPAGSAGRSRRGDQGCRRDYEDPYGGCVGAPIVSMVRGSNYYEYHLVWHRRLPSILLLLSSLTHLLHHDAQSGDQRSGLDSDLKKLTVLQHLGHSRLLACWVTNLASKTWPPSAADPAPPRSVGIRLPLREIIRPRTVSAAAIELGLEDRVGMIERLCSQP